MGKSRMKIAWPGMSAAHERLASFAIAAVLSLACIGLLAWQQPAAGDEQAMVVPAPATDEAGHGPGVETAVLAGGCFWGMQGVFEHVKGVTRVVSGYTGGAAADAHYDDVGTGRTGHAESVQITYDPRQISYGQILQIYFSVAHDPTEENRQGPDVGTQYRSAIFPLDADQARIAQAYIAQLGKAKVYAAPLATRVETHKSFYPAEAYHQDFLSQNPTYPYIVINDLPKIDNLKRLFPDQYRNQPMLVSVALH